MSSKLPHDDLLLNVRKDIVSDLPDFRVVSETHFQLPVEQTKSLESLILESQSKEEKNQVFKLNKTDEVFNRKQQELEQEIIKAIRNSRNPLVGRDNFVSKGASEGNSQANSSSSKSKNQRSTNVIRFKNDVNEFEHPSDSNKKLMDTISAPSRYEQNDIDQMSDGETIEIESKNESIKNENLEESKQKDKNNSKKEKRVNFNGCPAEQELPENNNRGYFKKYRSLGRNPKCFYKKYDYYDLSNVDYDGNQTASSAFEFLRELEKRDKKNKNPNSIEDELENLALSKPVFNKEVMKKKMVNEDQGTVKRLKHKMAVLSFQDDL
jgi:hypothetical protein